MPKRPGPTRRDFIKSVSLAPLITHANETTSEDSTTDQLLEDADPTIEYGEQGYGEERYGGGLIPPILDDSRDRVRRARDRVSSLFDDEDDGPGSSSAGDDEPGVLDRILGLFSDDGESGSSSDRPSMISRILEALFGDESDV